jgi:N-acyl-L-homoserine lactone synthetase
MHKALRKIVTVTEGGKRKRMSMAEIIVTRLANRVTSGDPKAIVTATAILRQGRQAVAEGPLELSITEGELDY